MSRRKAGVRADHRAFPEAWAGLARRPHSPDSCVTKLTARRGLFSLLLSEFYFILKVGMTRR